MRRFLLFLLFTFGAGCGILSAQQGIGKIGKTMDDDNSHYTNVGNIGLTITNFGMYGHGFSLWPKQPSCEYPLGSGIEHIFDGGLWVGSYISYDTLGHGRVGPFVTTASVDAASVSTRGGGFEWTNAKGSSIIQRSSILDSPFFSPDAVSQQDFVMDYSDTSVVLLNGEPIVDHSPLGLAVHHESYAWNYPFANFFVIMNYWIKNVSNKYLDTVYVGLWTDAVVRNTKVTSPNTGTPFFNKGGDGYSDSMKIAYEFDATGDIGLTDSYVGIQLLGSSYPDANAHFVCWQHSNTSDPNYFTPMTDQDRYRKMEGFFGGNNVFGSGINPSDLKVPSNRSITITCGPIKRLAPGDSVNVVFAIVCAKKYGVDPAAYDTDEQRKNLYNNAEWALKAYYGEDRNRNGILDPGEDNDGNGKITRYILPSPPLPPKVKVVPENQKATIYWDRRAEGSVDPISGKKDFEGYRLYRTNAGYELGQQQDLLTSLALAAEFDSLGNDIGYNTGYGAVLLKEPVTFAGDTTKYWYKFEVNNLLNGWQYVFAVTAFDKGDAANNLSSLESSSLANYQKIIPGTVATSNDNAQIGVYPNPYYGNAYWDGNSERLRKIYFYNLPARCELTIYTLSGDIVKKINHTQESNGADLRWFDNYSSDKKQIMSGGEHAWDLITDNDQAIATGLYLFTVKDLVTGKIKTGKFLVVK
jgi:hypothetical protein